MGTRRAVVVALGAVALTMTTIVLAEGCGKTDREGWSGTDYIRFPEHDATSQMMFVFGENDQRHLAAMVVIRGTDLLWSGGSQGSTKKPILYRFTESYAHHGPGEDRTVPSGGQIGGKQRLSAECEIDGAFNGTMTIGDTAYDLARGRVFMLEAVDGVVKATQTALPAENSPFSKAEDFRSPLLAHDPFREFLGLSPEDE